MFLQLLRGVSAIVMAGETDLPYGQKFEKITP